MAMPCGFGAGGMPVGLQLIGNYFAEAQLLNVAHRFQQATDFHARARRHAERLDMSKLIQGWEVVIGLETHAQLSTQLEDLLAARRRRSAPSRTRRPARWTSRCPARCRC